MPSTIEYESTIVSSCYQYVRDGIELYTERGCASHSAVITVVQVCLFSSKRNPTPAVIPESPNRGECESSDRDNVLQSIHNGIVQEA